MSTWTSRSTGHDLFCFSVRSFRYQQRETMDRCRRDEEGDAATCVYCTSGCVATLALWKAPCDTLYYARECYAAKFSNHAPFIFSTLSKRSYQPVPLGLFNEGLLFFACCSLQVKPLLRPSSQYHGNCCSTILFQHMSKMATFSFTDSGPPSHQPRRVSLVIPPRYVADADTQKQHGQSPPPMDDFIIRPQP